MFNVHHEMKTCPKCKKEKDESCFHKNKIKKDGLTVYCKECIRIKNNNHNLLNKEQIKKKKRDTYNDGSGRYYKMKIRSRLKLKIGEAPPQILVDTIFLINKTKQLCRTLNN